MEIVNPCSALLSNYEVYKVLKETREEQKNIRTNFVKSNLRNLNTIAYETLKYFENISPCRFSSDTTIPEFVQSVKEYNLSKSELVQLINLRPTTHVELHAVIEECEERYSENQIASLLEIVRAHLYKNTRPRTSDSVSSYLSPNEDVDLLSSQVLHNSSLSHEEEVADSTLVEMNNGGKRKRTKKVSSGEDAFDEIVTVNRNRKAAVIISDEEEGEETGEKEDKTLTCEVLSESKIKSLTGDNKDKVKLKIKNTSKKFKDKARRKPKDKRRVSISDEINVLNIY